MEKVSRKLLSYLAILKSVVDEIDSNESCEKHNFSYDLFMLIALDELNRNAKPSYVAFTVLNEYLNNCIEEIRRVGLSGTARIAYSLPGGKCLKFAINLVGIALNKNEITNIAKRNNKYKCFGNYYAWDDKFFSMVTDLYAEDVADDWIKLLGVTIHECVYISMAIAKNGIDKTQDLIDKLYSCVMNNIDTEKQFDELNISFMFDYSKYDKATHIRNIFKFISDLKTSSDVQFKSIKDFIQFLIDTNNSLDWSDLVGLSNWGIKYENKKPFLVILDPGLDEKTSEKYYLGNFDFDNDEFINGDDDDDIL